MARSFTRAAGNYLEMTSPPVTAPPFTVSYWFYATDTTNIHYGWSASANIGGNVSYFFVGPRGDVSGDPIHAIADNEPSGTGIAATSTGYTANTWNHACGVFTSSTSRTAYLNGGGKVTNTTSAVPDSINTMNIGAFYYTNTRFAGFDGRVAELVIYNAALDDAEVAALADGYSPLSIRPASRVAYYPLGGHYGQLDVDRWKNRYDLTAYNSPTWADHPRVIYPRRSFWFPSPITAAPTVYTLEALPASVDVVGQSASLSAVRKITAQPATIEVVGQAATLRVVRKIVASPATVDVVGQSATLTRARTLTANAAEVQVSGQAAGLTATRKITASPAAIEVVGQSANLRVVRRIVASPATVEVSGQTAVTRRTALLQGLAATIAVVGQAAVLTYSGEAAVVTEDWIGVDKATGRTPKATATHRVGTATAIGRVSKATAYQRPV